MGCGSPSAGRASPDRSGTAFDLCGSNPSPCIQSVQTAGTMQLSHHNSFHRSIPPQALLVAMVRAGRRETRVEGQKSTGHTNRRVGWFRNRPPSAFSAAAISPKRDALADACEAAPSRQLQETWLGKVADDWSPRCDIVLHRTVAGYVRELGNGSQNSSGCATIGYRKRARRQTPRRSAGRCRGLDDLGLATRVDARRAG